MNCLTESHAFMMLTLVLVFLVICFIALDHKLDKIIKMLKDEEDEKGRP